MVWVCKSKHGTSVKRRLFFLASKLHYILYNATEHLGHYWDSYIDMFLYAFSVFLHVPAL